jgi:hypothetical protein
MVDDLIARLRVQATQEAATQEAKRRETQPERVELLWRLEREYEGVLHYSNRAGNEASTRGLATQIAKFLSAVRAVGWGDRFEALQPNDDDAWTLALSIYRRCWEGDIDGATAQLDKAEAIGPSWARARITDALQRTLPNAIVSPPKPQSVSPFDAYLAELRAIDTPQALLSQCNQLRQKLDPSSEDRTITTYQAPATLRELWGAMRRIGGTVARAPALLKLDPKDPAFFAAAVTGRIEEMIHSEDALQALDDVVSWCIQRGAVADNAVIPPSGQGEGTAANTSKRKRKTGRRPLAVTDPKFQVYDRIRRESGTTAEKRARLTADRDFMELFKASGAKWKTVFKNARAYFSQPGKKQETSST